MRNVARLRKLKGWNQTDLANEVGVNQATISKAEKGDGGVSLRTYQAIADALEVPLYELFIDDAATAELRLLAAFRDLSEDRKQGWIDLLDGPLVSQNQQPR